MLAIRLPENIEKRLDLLARRTGRSKTSFAREAILTHLEDIEDAFLADEQLELLRSGQEETVPIERLIEKYGLED
jgi:RHH-type rel operon transcriptional repressor/antitoxin RelB